MRRHTLAPILVYTENRKNSMKDSKRNNERNGKGTARTTARIAARTTREKQPGRQQPPVVFVLLLVFGVRMGAPGNEH